MTDLSIGAHLREPMRAYVGIEGRERLYACWDRIWVPTPSTRQAFVALRDCMDAAPSTKPRGLILTGDADTGKSRTMQAFKDAHPPRDDAESEYARVPVVYITAPDTPNKTAILKKILVEMGHPLLYNAREEDLKQHTVNMIRRCQVGTIMIDEFADIERGSMSKAVVEFLVFMKNLINECGRPFVVAGTKQLLDLVGGEPQIAGRLNRVEVLRPLDMEAFVDAVRAFEMVIPLRKPSLLKESEDALQMLFTQSEGYIGRLSNILHDASQVAIETKEERITLEVLKKVKDNSIAAVGRRGA